RTTLGARTNEVERARRRETCRELRPARYTAPGMVPEVRAPATVAEYRGEFLAEVRQSEDREPRAFPGSRLQPGSSRARGATTVASAGTSRATSACAPIVARAPTVTPWSTVAPVPR